MRRYAVGQELDTLLPSDDDYRRHMTAGRHKHRTNTSCPDPLPRSQASTSSADSEASVSNFLTKGRMLVPSAHVHGPDDGDKRRRVQQACDTCRKKKVRCGGPQARGRACSHCARYGYTCVFADAARNRAPPLSYVEAIEARIVKMEHLIASLAPGVDFSDRIGEPMVRPDQKRGEAAAVHELIYTTQLEPGSSQSGMNGHGSFCRCDTCSTEEARSCRLIVNAESAFNQAGHGEDLLDDDVAFVESRFGMVELSPKLGHTQDAELGSSISFERIIAREEGVVASPSKVCAGDEAFQNHKFIGMASAVLPLPLLARYCKRPPGEPSIHSRGIRSKFWEVPMALLDPFADPTDASAASPDPSLAEDLLKVFFGRVNREYPLIDEVDFRQQMQHRGSERERTERLGLSLSIFMVASQYLADDAEAATGDVPISRGMPYWQAAMTLVSRNSRIRNPLYRVQCLLLSTIYQLGFPISASTSWLHLGEAIRTLQDVGAHRKHAAKKLGLSRLEQEAYKRAFWVAYSLDREAASALGRPLMLHDEDIDLELPTEIDDSDLFNSFMAESCLVRPSGSSGSVSAFLCSLRLDQIIGRILRTVYAPNDAKTRSSTACHDANRGTKSVIDSDLTEWLQTVPTQLRIDSDEADDNRLLQSSTLLSKYHYCRILLHRVHISDKKTAGDSSSSTNLSSHAICTDAAHSITRLVKRLRGRNLQNEVGIPMAFRIMSASSVLLMAALTSSSEDGRALSAAATDLRLLLDVLRSMELQWQLCGKAVDILESLVVSTGMATMPRKLTEDVQDVERWQVSSCQLDGVLDGELHPPQGDEPVFDSRTAGGKLEVQSEKDDHKVAGKVCLSKDCEFSPSETIQLRSSIRRLCTQSTEAKHANLSATSTLTDSPVARVDVHTPGASLEPDTLQAETRPHLPCVGGALFLSFNPRESLDAAVWDDEQQREGLQGPDTREGASVIARGTPASDVLEDHGLENIMEDMVSAHVGSWFDESQHTY